MQSSQVSSFFEDSKAKDFAVESSPVAHGRVTVLAAPMWDLIGSALSLEHGYDRRIDRNIANTYAKLYASRSVSSAQMTTVFSSHLVNSLGEYELSSLVLGITDIKLSADGIDWVDISIGSTELALDLVAGTGMLNFDAPRGTYKYISFALSHISYTRFGCAESQLKDVAEIVVATTGAEARLLGQDSPRLYRSENNDYDSLHEILYYKHSRPVDLLQNPDDVQRNEMLSTTVEAKGNSRRIEKFSSELSRQTQRLPSLEVVESHYWHLTNPLDVLESEQIDIQISLVPKWTTLKPRVCEVVPADFRFLVGERREVLESMLQFSESK